MFAQSITSTSKNNIYPTGESYAAFKASYDTCVKHYLGRFSSRLIAELTHSCRRRSWLFTPPDNWQRFLTDFISRRLSTPNVFRSGRFTPCVLPPFAEQFACKRNNNIPNNLPSAIIKREEKKRKNSSAITSSRSEIARRVRDFLELARFSASRFSRKRARRDTRALSLLGNCLRLSGLHLAACEYRMQASRSERASERKQGLGMGSTIARVSLFASFFITIVSFF